MSFIARDEGTRDGFPLYLTLNLPTTTSGLDADYETTHSYHWKAICHTTPDGALPQSFGSSILPPSTSKKSTKASKPRPCRKSQHVPHHGAWSVEMSLTDVSVVSVDRAATTDRSRGEREGAADDVAMRVYEVDGQSRRWRDKVRSLMIHVSWQNPSCQVDINSSSSSSSSTWLPQSCTVRWQIVNVRVVNVTHWKTRCSDLFFRTSLAPPSVLT